MPVVLLPDLPPLQDAALTLAKSLALVAVPRVEPGMTRWLEYSPEGLGLVHCTGRGRTVVRAEFASGRARHRRLHGGGRGEALARAVGLNKGVLPRVVDATAGLGKDAFVLAALGCDVTLIERSPLVAALLADGLSRAVVSGEVELVTIARRMELVVADSAQWLAQLAPEHRPDVIYLDPMYPETGGKAAVKKDMAALRELLGPDADGECLLRQALATARHRVVVKRPRLGVALPGPEPGYQLVGKSSRFDIYPLRAFR